MFPYTVKYNESESDIQNNYLLYKIDKQFQNSFELLENFVNSWNFFNFFQIFILLNMDMRRNRPY